MTITVPLSDIVVQLLICIAAIDAIYKGYLIWKYKVIKTYFPISLFALIDGWINGKEAKERRLRKLFDGDRMVWMGINGVYGGAITLSFGIDLLIKSIRSISIGP
jgi:hypothetical protein